MVDFFKKLTLAKKLRFIVRLVLFIVIPGITIYMYHDIQEDAVLVVGSFVEIIIIHVVVGAIYTAITGKDDEFKH